MNRKKLWALALVAVISFCALGFAFLSKASETVPTVYKNDTKYSIEEYPPEMIDGVLHMPVSFFVGLDNIQYEYSSSPSGFYLRNETTGRFISFSFNSTGIVVDSSFESVTFPIANSTVYMPLEYCAQILSLKIEKTSDTKTNRIRLSDGTQQLTFDELIELYDPVKTPDNPPVIEPDNPTPVDPSRPADRELYITVDNCHDSDTELILDELKSADVKATFFFSREDIQTYPETVVRAFVEGHGIGISTKTTDISDIDAANNALYSILNFKSRLIRVVSDKNVTDLPSGYIMHQCDINAHSNLQSGARSVARNIYNSTFSRNRTIIRLNSDSYAADVIRQLLYYVSDDEYITVEILRPTTEKETN